MVSERLRRIPAICHALSDEKRVRIIETLRKGECCVCDLAGALGVRQSLLSFHLGILKKAGLVCDRRDGRWVHYRIDPDRFAELGEFASGVRRSVREAGRSACCRHAAVRASRNAGYLREARKG